MATPPRTPAYSVNEAWPAAEPPRGSQREEFREPERLHASRNRPPGQMREYSDRKTLKKAGGSAFTTLLLREKGEKCLSGN